METLRFLWVTVSETLLRVLPFPCRRGLVRIGRPDRNAPVLLTGNFRLTVERVKRALRGCDVYLLVANSRGVNVWCAATGGLLTNHDVVAALKTSGIEDLVAHRSLILPQLAATGIDARDLHRRTGWRAIWGPVEAADLPRFLASGLTKTREMRTVTFPWPRRLEMAIAWAFPIWLLALVVYPLWPASFIPLTILIWVSSPILFLLFPLYQHRLGRRSQNVGFVFFDFGERGGLLIVWILSIAAIAGYAVVATADPGTTIVRWGLASLVTLFLLSLDLAGSTPMYKSGIHPERRLGIALEEEKCRGAGFCEQVCPVDVFSIDEDRKIATMPRASHCVQCGACIVQCPFDALSLRGSSGETVTPATVRRFKLNLLGVRSRPRGPEGPAAAPGGENEAPAAQGAVSSDSEEGARPRAT